MASSHNRPCHVLVRGIFLSLLLILSGCSGLLPRIQDAAVDAARDPWTWVPLAGAGAIALTGTDHEISDWAEARTPLYGSNENALEASDTFREASRASAQLTLLVASKRGDGHWLKEKSIDAAGGFAGVMAAKDLTGMLKRTTQRPRPDGSNDESFPSAHATDAFANATVARYFANGLPLGKPVRGGVKWATSGFAVATAWARVEGGVHYPTDVLVGAAIANFSSRFFLGLTEEPRSWWFKPRRDGDAIIIEMEKEF
ncbi:phosphatase PAP2 family protein [Thiohalomonas denitrificans]|uniref:phosphatase PAP2 family protein n=1 Tax=Thiohalomonas denitrificans TaxID=415747 RepID=UPI0026EC0B6B|nr:phosphatase PAP2 family protein [Thiohalomonas denitrificans]